MQVAAWAVVLGGPGPPPDGGGPAWILFTTLDLKLFPVELQKVVSKGPLNYEQKMENSTTKLKFLKNGTFYNFFTKWHKNLEIFEVSAFGAKIFSKINK